MAIWQFDVAFARGSAETVFPAALRARADEVLLSRFGAPWQMLERWLVYGAEEGNRLDLAWDEDGRFELSARIDARSEADAFLAQLCTLAVDLGCHIRNSSTMERIGTSVDSLKAELMQSTAWDFALGSRLATFRP